MDESIKIATVGHTSIGANTETKKIPIVPGHNEIALLLMMRIWQETGTGARNNKLKWIVWRKSDQDFTSTALDEVSLDSQNDDVIAIGMFWHDIQAANLASFSIPVDTIKFPLPGIPLLRPPQLVSEAVVGGQLVVAQFYYKLKTISDAEMTKLMLKDKGRL